MKLLLLSNSTHADFSTNYIHEFLDKVDTDILFIPYAAVRLSHVQYEERVNLAWSGIERQVKSIHHFSNPKEAVRKSKAIVVGGGNTWQLVKTLHEYDLMNEIKEHVNSGIPYIGWSAGSNIACPTLKTTNDMPVVEPSSFETLGLIPFQINPHYMDANPDGHRGETREERIEEFIELNRNIYVAGLRENTLLSYHKGKIKLQGNRTVRIFKYGEEPKEFNSDDDLSFLIQ
ncbi:dipeptidase PepE [Apibacter raozihei]|uniref:dipeptidase PepE n=1 Tax=Apibacter raozihei TaxID=2500547 RepID=UPI000FE332E2|nr:dipeptidase PepE [Apibacter raozihei]